MDLEVVGRHALLFDDDAAAAFVNTEDALVQWNSLLIDRYDVRHLLSSPPPPRRRRNLQQTHSSSSSASVSSLESELDHERYLDLPTSSEEQDEGANPVDTGGYNAVAFSYGNSNDSSDQKTAESGLECPGFRPPFPVPESLLQSVPTTEKVHQIIARTAMFVSKHGGQSEIVLRVKQGDNPAFGFLMPDHHLHAYFRFLVDHQELLQPDFDGKHQYEEKISSSELGGGGGALSLLGSLYGSVEDEDGAAENASASKENVSGDAFDVSTTVFHDSEKKESPVHTAVKDETAVSKPLLPSKAKATPLRKNSFVGVFKAGSSGTKKEGESVLLSAAADKLQASQPAMSKIEPLILEPPSDLKRLVDKIVEFIMKNGKQFETVLVEQDNEHGRFPFLLPSNQYHPYYLKVLQKAQESKLTGKSFLNEKDGLVGHGGPDKKTSLSKEGDTLSLGSAGFDIPYDSDKKEKFKMILGKSKKDGPDPPPKTTQQQFGVSVDAASAAAILQAATRGIKYPNLGILSSTSLNGNSHGHSSEGGPAPSLGSLLSSQPESVIPKSNPNGEQSVSVPIAKAIAKTAALEAASEADSSEAHLTKEQKLKSERLKRAKMFVTMLKSGAPPLKTETFRGLSAEPQESGVSGSVAEVNLVAKEREGSSAPLDVDTSDKIEKSERKHSGDEYNERRSRRKYRSRSSKHEEEEEKEEEKEEEDDEKVEHKHYKKKHRSHRSSLGDDGEEEKGEEELDDKRSKKKHRSHLSSHEDDEDERDHKYSRKKRRSHRSSRDEVDEEDEEERAHRHSRRKKHRSHHSSRHSRDGHNHRRRHSSSKDRESRHRHKHDIASDDEHRHQSRSDKHRKGSHSEREELEEGEISSKISDQSRGSVGGGAASREASVDLLFQDRSAPSQPFETTEVSEDFRAKIRAILMASL